MTTLVDTRWIGSHGIGRFASEVIKRLDDVHALKDMLSPVNPLDSVWGGWKIGQVKPQPEVYFSPGYTPPLWCSVPFVFVIHDLNHIDRPESYSALKCVYYNYVMRPACHRSFRVLTVSEFSRKRIIEWSGVPKEKVINVGNGVDEAFQAKGVIHKPGYLYFLYVGNRKPHKNITRLLKAFAISGLGSEMKLVLSGEPDKEIMQIIINYELQELVVFAGFLNDTALAELYRGALALLLPSLYEGFGLPIAEAMACGTPVLTSNVAAMPEVSGNAGLLVNPHSVDEISEGMSVVVENGALRKKMIVNGFVQVKKFTWENTAGKVKEVLHDAIKNGNKL